MPTELEQRHTRVVELAGFHVCGRHRALFAFRQVSIWRIGKAAEIQLTGRASEVFSSSSFAAKHGYTTCLPIPRSAGAT